MQAEVEVKELPATFFERAFALATCVGAVAGAFVVGWFDPVNAGFFPTCPLYTMTGIACPGCGITRGMHALMHGDIVGALDFNLIMPGFLFFFAYLFVSQFLVFWRGYGLTYRIFTQKIIWGFFTVAILFTVLRNLPWYPFNVLYP